MIKYKSIFEDYGTWKVWRYKGHWHREDGPAYETATSKAWYYLDKEHREDGPAVIYSSGAVEYYYHGKKIEASSDKEFKRKIKLLAFL